MSRHANQTRVGALTASIIPILFAIAVAAPPVDAADERPSEIRYDIPGAIPITRLDAMQAPAIEVEILDHSISPRLTVLNESSRLRWINHSRAPSRIVFEREVAAAMVCRSLINFSIVDDELKSAELHLLDVANFCNLAPGRYPYKIIRNDPASGARRRLDGLLVVEPGSVTRTLAASALD